MEKREVKAAPGRLINAIANIGYDKEVALCDLMDNSMDANAHKIAVHLLSKPRDDGKKDTIEQYLIADDGYGMTEEELLNAFQLGSERAYPQHALGKFGIGLKSAGLSLANKIIVITKQEETNLLCGILSKQYIEESGKYEIDLGTPPVEYEELWKQYTTNEKQGTLLILEELNEPTYATEFINYFKRHCALVYHLFLEDERRQLSIIVNADSIQPIDPLFLAEARSNGKLDPSTWSGRTPHVLIEHQDLQLDDGTKCEIAATQLIHPPTFEKEGRRAEMRDKYCIETDPYTKRPRHGFYVYRNKRIIVMAELFRGVVSREQSAWAFRARLMFDESADKAMSLDVKKRHCQLPPKARETLRLMIQPYHSMSTAAWKDVGHRTSEEQKVSKEKIANESISNSPVSKTDYIPPSIHIDSEEDREKRTQLQQKVAQKTLETIKDEQVSKEFLEQQAREQKKVIQVKGLKSNALWDVYPDVKLGEVEAIINGYNTWVEKAYQAAESEARITVLLHQMFYLLARAELDVKTHDWPGLPAPDIIAKVFEKFRTIAGSIAESLADTLEEELNKLGDIEQTEGSENSD